MNSKFLIGAVVGLVVGVIAALVMRADYFSKTILRW